MGSTDMTSRLKLVPLVALFAMLEAGCSSSPAYSPPPERRAAEQCPVGETWVCRDRYPSRLETENDTAKFCYCENILHAR
jgi:hypothetical protein